MNSNRFFFIFLLISFSLSVCTSGVVFAQCSTSSNSGSIPTPSVPEFTVELIDNSSAFQLRIKNKPYTPIRKDGHTCGYYYRLRVKNNYTDMSSPLAVDYITRSNAEYTVVTYVFGVDGIPNLAHGSKFDVQLQAIIGVMEQIPRAIGFVDVVYDTHVTGESSNWSDPITVSIPLFTSTTNSPSPNSFELSVPEFTVGYVDYSYDVPPTYGMDQFTGEEVIINHGRHVDERSVTFLIKNQPFTSYYDSDGNEINLYFNFRFKGSYGEAWEYYPFSESGRGTRRYSTQFVSLTDESPKLPASNSEYTNITFSLSFLFRADVPPIGSQIDFQVQVLTGYIYSAGDGYSGFNGQRSDWSDTQTLTISSLDPPTPSTEPEPSEPVSTEPETTESKPEKSIITDIISNETPETTPTDATWPAIIILALIGVANIILLIYFIKRR